MLQRSELEQFLQTEEDLSIRCIGGESHRPPEDVGGTSTYEEFLLAISIILVIKDIHDLSFFYQKYGLPVLRKSNTIQFDYIFKLREQGFHAGNKVSPFHIIRDKLF